MFVRLAVETNIATVLLTKGNIVGAGREIQVVLRDPEWPSFPYAVYLHGMISALNGNCVEAKKEWAASMGAETTITHTPDGLCPN